MIRALVIDDERLARVELKSMLAEFANIQVVGEAQNAEQAKQQIAELQPDLIFLDIQMPGKDGFELLQELDSVPQVIFVTAYDQYAIRAFEHSALDYLVKPVEQPRLQTALQKVHQLQQAPPNQTATAMNRDEKVFLKDGDQCWFVRLSQISAFESVGNYCRVFFDKHHPLIRRSLNQLELKLPDALFFRISRQHIINLEHIESVNTAISGNLEVRLINGLVLEMSRRQSQEFRELKSL